MARLDWQPYVGRCSHGTGPLQQLQTGSFWRNPAASEEGATGIGKGGRMSKEPLILKNPRGWFAAGAEVQKAMELLSDGAFRLFIYLCLNARRDNGVLDGSLTQLAKNIKRGTYTVRLYLREMEAMGICRFRFGHNPMGKGMVEVTEDFWPYQRSLQEPASNDSTEFVAAIRKMLQARACINTLVSAADEILAREWFDRGFSLELIEQTILIGCIRKYVSWRDNKTRSVIGSLKYFQSVLEEVQGMKVDHEYWDYLRYRLTRIENEWKSNHSEPPLHKTNNEGVLGLEMS
jgi:hypothetical protein